MIPRHGRLGAGAIVGGGASDGARDRDAADEGNEKIGESLRDQFGVGIVPVPDHRIGDHGGQQAFERGQQGDRQRGGQQRQDEVGAKTRQINGRQAAKECRRICCRSSRRADERGPQRQCRQQRDDGTGHAWEEASAPGESGPGSRSPSRSGRLGAEVHAGQRAHTRKKFARYSRQLEAEEIFYLGRSDQQGNAVGKADDDWPGDELDRVAESVRIPGIAGSHRPSW